LSKVVLDASEFVLDLPEFFKCNQCLLLLELKPFVVKNPQAGLYNLRIIKDTLIV